MSRVRKKLRLFRIVLVKLLLSLFLLSVLWVLLYRFMAPPFTLQMMTKRNLSEREEKAIRYQYVALEEVSVHVPVAMIAAEDQLFFVHNGFDYKAIREAFKRNQKGKNIRGGSTISQQVAKNVFLWHGRSYFRKALEAYFTLLIEVFWSKERIMETYINIAEMGDQVFGVEAASRQYFKKPAKDLNREQAALLAAVLPNPIKYSVKKPSGYVTKKKNRIIRNMRRLRGSEYIEPLQKYAE